MKFIRLTGLLALLLGATLAATPTASLKQTPKSRPRPVRRSASANVERRIDALLARMTLAEKLGQLQQLDGHADGRFKDEYLELVRKGQLGSTLNVRGARNTNELQRIAVEQTRLKIPMIFGFDVIHGYRTIFPIPLGEAATWDPAAVERSAAIAAKEARAAGVHWTFAPMVDIARDARWGRIAEGSGEDPFLGAAMARARVRGFQGSDYSATDKVVACAKHWVAYGAAEAGRDYNTTDVSERTLREVYFPPFKAALDAGAGTFMSAFNDLNGVPTSANPFTLTAVLRREWKFDGIVVSDYESVKELMNHGLAANEKEAAAAGLNAGVDMEMVSRLYNKHGAELLRERQISRATIDEAVRRVLRIKFRLGLFEKPFADEARERSSIFLPEHLAFAREAAARSLVLLKNDGRLLPLSKSVNEIAVIGPLADSQKDVIGSWTGDGKPEDAVSLLAGIKSKVSRQTIVRYAKGCEINDDSASGFDEAVLIARDADVAIVVVGESAEMSGEAASRSSLDLPGRQLDLVKAIHATGKPVVVVLMNGRPLTITWMGENVSSILETWFAGSQAGNAIADVLFGDVNPGGKLPVTFPRTVGQAPLYYNYKRTGRPPAADNKYTSKYLDVPWTPLFPFGYGLSYTRFRFSDLQLSAQRITPDGSLNVSVEVENIGDRAGDEVVQLYIRDLAASVTRPVKELKGFQRLTLQPGEKKRVELKLTAGQLGFYNREMKFVVEPGEFKVMVGPNSEDLIEAKFEVARR
ncbi:MAG TPA: glycoside hydrolase family 3 N-terminal domain-containing protein [Pyrinomonadaceae bacterium]|nr:glycoside hydrolase family 3 N-terminal domain-containing protein [Pyrinomonadaceae bacterium]